MKTELVDKIINVFNTKNNGELSDRNAIITRLLEEKHITIEEVILLSQKTIIELNVENLEMSSGAKIVGGSDLESTKVL